MAIVFLSLVKKRAVVTVEINKSSCGRKRGKKMFLFAFHIKERAFSSFLFFYFFFLFSNVFFFGSLVSSLPGLPTETSLLSFLKENMADDGVVLCRDEQSATADGADLSL